MTAIAIGNAPIPGIEPPTFQVFEGGELAGCAAERLDRGHLDRRCWTASVCADPANMNQSPGRTLCGPEGWYYLEASTRDLMCRTIARHFFDYRRRRQAIQRVDGRGSWWSGLRSGCQQLPASLHH